MPDHDGEIIIPVRLDSDEFKKDLANLSKDLRDNVEQFKKYGSNGNIKEALELQKKITEEIEKQIKAETQTRDKFVFESPELKGTPEFDEQIEKINGKLYNLHRVLEVIQNTKFDKPFIDLGFDGFETEIEKLTRLLEEKKEQIENLKEQYNRFLDRTDKTKEQLYIEQEINNQLEKREAIIDRLSKFQSLQLSQSEISSLQTELTETNKNIKTLKKELFEVKLHPESTQSVKDLRKEISESKKEAEELQKQLNIAIRKAAMPQSINTGKLSASIHKLNTSTRDFGNTFNRTFKGLKSPIEEVSDRITHLGRRILRIGSYVLFFNVIRGGFRQLRDYIGGVLSTNDEFIKSLNQIKSNLMVAFYPIYQYILPALNNLMQTLVRASAYLAQFISKLMGKDIKQSQEGAKALWEQSKAIKDGTASRQGATKSVKDQKAAFDKLGKSIKGSKKELASFDKIILLNQNKEKEPKIKTPKDDGFVFSPTLAFDDTYDNILSWWENIGKIIDNTKEKIIEFGIAFTKGFDFAFADRNFSEIYDKTTKIGNHLKEIFDDPEIQTGFDRSLMSWSTALGAVAGATASIGVTIGRAIVGGFEKFLDENKNVIKKDLDRTFNVSVDCSNLVTSVSGAIANIFSVFGDEHSQQIVSDFMTTIYNIFNRGFGFITEMVVDVAKVIFKPFITHQNDLKEALGGILEWASILTGDIKNLFTGIVNTMTDSYDNGIKPVVEWLVELWDKAAGEMIVYFKNQVDNAINFVKGSRKVFKGVWDFITGDAQTASDGLKRIGEGLKQIFKSIMNHIIDKVNLALGLLKSGINFGISTLNRIPGVNISPIPDSSLKIQRIEGYAQGAVFKGGDPILAYLNDQPRGQTNIETPLNTMIDAFNQALAQNNNTGNVVVQAEGDVAGIINMLRFNIKQRDELIGTNYIQDGIFA